MLSPFALFRRARANRRRRNTRRLRANAQMRLRNIDPTRQALQRTVLM